MWQIMVEALQRSASALKMEKFLRKSLPMFMELAAIQCQIAKRKLILMQFMLGEISSMSWTWEVTKYGDIKS